MLERAIHSVRLESPGAEPIAATRERLRDVFPRGSTRRMTQLGLLLGSVLHDLQPALDDTLVYASTFAETRALEDYLASFPTASPTLFQTSIHPSAVQQVMIARQQPVRQFFAHTGHDHLIAHAVQSALLANTARAVLCGGEERGTWLLEHGAASAATFAFAVELGTDMNRAIGTLRLERSGEPAQPLLLPRFFAALRAREPLTQTTALGQRLSLTWR